MSGQKGRWKDGCYRTLYGWMLQDPMLQNPSGDPNNQNDTTHQVPVASLKYFLIYLFNYFKSIIYT